MKHIKTFEENSNKYSKHDELIDKYDKLKNLAIEFKNSSKYEDCEFIVQKYDNLGGGRFILFRIEGEEELAHGTPDKIRQYLIMRKIPKELVYDYDLVKEKDLN